jgi:hypothetical protein
MTAVVELVKPLTGALSDADLYICSRCHRVVKKKETMFPKKSLSGWDELQLVDGVTMLQPTKHEHGSPSSLADSSTVHQIRPRECSFKTSIAEYTAEHLSKYV